MSETLRTPRLRIRELEEGDLDAVLAVRRSDPDHLARTEGSAGEPGRYDREMLERDVQVGWMMPGRHQLVLVEGEEVVGLADLLEENPQDGLPWIGLVLIRADRRRAGLGSEAARALLEQGRSAFGWTKVRAAADEDDPVALAFAERLGFAPVARREAPEVPRIVLETELGP